MARIKGLRKVHRYSAEFKLKAVKLSQIEGVRVQDVAVSEPKAGEQRVAADERAMASWCALAGELGVGQPESRGI